MFANREEAGRQLATLLKAYESQPKTCVIGLPRGGVVTAASVALALHLPLDVVCPRKIAAPMQPEYALGAIAEHGEALFDLHALQYLGLSAQDLAEETNLARLEARRRTQLYRSHFAHPSLKGATLIVVDDGIATGLTMEAAILSLKQEEPKRLIVAVPVLPAERVAAWTKKVDEFYYILAPEHFYAVGQFYRDFRGVEDDEVLRILREVATPKE